MLRRWWKFTPWWPIRLGVIGALVAAIGAVMLRDWLLLIWTLNAAGWAYATGEEHRAREAWRKARGFP